ncbi:MAG: hemolysin family protein [bacterium]
MTVGWYLGWVLLLLVLEGFFSGSEAAVLASDRIQMRAEAARGGRGASRVEKMLKRPERIVGTTLMGSRLTMAANTILVSFLIATRVPSDLAAFLAVVALLPFILFCGEVLPRTLLQRRADFFAPRVAPFLWIASWFFWPLLWLFTRLPGSLSRLARKSLHLPPGLLLKPVDLKLLLRTPAAGTDMLADEIRMVDRLIDLSGKTVEEVMIPLVEVTAMAETASWEQAAQVIVEKGYSRLPVFRERIVHIVGVLNQFDLLLSKDRAAGIARLVRPAFYVPETKQVYELLLQMQRTGSNMAIAVDEYGGAVGIITIEDILEEIVGEIEDEYDPTRSFFLKLGPASYLLDGRIEIQFLNEKLPLRLPEGDYETLGGFLTTRMGRIPKEKETLRLGGLLFTIEKATYRAIRQVRLDVQGREKGKGER